MRNNQAAGSVLNSTAGSLPIAFCAEKIPLSGSPRNHSQDIDLQRIIEVERTQLGRRNGFFR
jgi:hypothetical protein